MHRHFVASCGNYSTPNEVASVDLFHGKLYASTPCGFKHRAQVARVATASSATTDLINARASEPNRVGQDSGLERHGLSISRYRIGTRTGTGQARIEPYGNEEQRETVYKNPQFSDEPKRMRIGQGIACRVRVPSLPPRSLFKTAIP